MQKEMNTPATTFAGSISKLLNHAIDVKGSSGSLYSLTTIKESLTAGVSSLQQSLLGSQPGASSSSSSALEQKPGYLDAGEALDGVLLSGEDASSFFQDTLQQITKNNHSSNGLSWWFKIIARHLLGHPGLQSPHAQQQLVNYMHKKMQKLTDDAEVANNFKSDLEKELQWYRNTQAEITMLKKNSNASSSEYKLNLLEKTLAKWESLGRDCGTVMCMFTLIFPDVLLAINENTKQSQTALDEEMKDAARTRMESISKRMERIKSFSDKIVKENNDTVNESIREQLANVYRISLDEKDKKDIQNAVDQLKEVVAPHVLNQSGEATKYEEVKEVIQNNETHLRVAALHISKFLDIRPVDKLVDKLESVIEDTFKKMNERANKLSEMTTKAIHYIMSTALQSFNNLITNKLSNTNDLKNAFL